MNKPFTSEKIKKAVGRWTNMSLLWLGRINQLSD